jgi:ethanolamine utilization protein EutA
MGGSPSNPTGHTIADHQYGDLQDHVHGPDSDHDHDVIDPGALEDNPIWLQDNVFLRSVGIDIGSAGTQVVFSELHMRRHGEDLTSRYVIVDRRTLYESPVSLTPYFDADHIDPRALGEIIDAAYAAARVAPSDVDTGVVILTGEALRRQNAEPLGRILAEKGGDFVTATAGHHMEAMLAAYGSGAAAKSFEQGSRILNVDIGGGTTKLAIIDHGRIVATAALAIGGRLAVVEDDRIVRLDPAGAWHAARAGLDWQTGSQATRQDFAKVAETMADLLVDALGGNAPGEIALTTPIGDLSAIDGIMVSGGVGEYVYEREDRDFNDLGLHLGREIRARAEDGRLGAPLMPGGACIRATALGAAQYSVQLSGSTSHISAPGRLLPKRNLPVVRPAVELRDSIDVSTVATAITHHLSMFDPADEAGDLAVAFAWSGPPDYRRIRAFAEGIAGGLADRITAGRPLYVMLDSDIARTLGAILADEIGIRNDMLILDGILLRDFDYVDIGRVRLPSNTVPVTVKSLLFHDNLGDLDRRSPAHHHHDHHEDHHHDETRGGHSHHHAKHASV